MQDNRYMIGVDIGTTSTKAILYQETGELISYHNYSYTLKTPDVHTAELDPEMILEAVVLTIEKVIKESKVNASNISFISFSSAMHSVIAIDKNNKPITNCITWADNRSAHWAQRIKENFDGLKIYQRTGTPIHSMSPLSKIMWLEHEHPEIARKTNKYIGIKEYIFLRFFNLYVVDYSIASCTGLMNLHTLTWDEEVLHIAGITEQKLSSIVSTQEIFTRCNPYYAKRMGVLSETKFIIGASDGVLSNIGVNAINPGELAITIGTSGAIRTIINKPKVDSKGHIFCYALTDEHWVVGGPVNNGGLVLRWIRDELAQKEVHKAQTLGLDAYDLITDLAESVPAGSEGLLFHPYLQGERAPLWNSNVKGSYFGLTLNHRREHMIRAAMEGVILNLYTVYLSLQEIVANNHEITLRATGGFAQSKLWRQMLADIFNREVTIPDNHESSCLGACILGLYALKKIDSFDIATNVIGETHRHKPIQENVTRYKGIIPIYLQLSQVLQPAYEAISKYQMKLNE